MTVQALDNETRPPSKCRSPSAETRSELYEALAPLGLPDPEPHRAEDGGWLHRALRAIGIGRGTGL
jgi:hypothetical protein